MTHDPAASSATAWATAADEAARAVVTRFGTRVWAIPGSHLAAVQRPGGIDNPFKPFHYWWQAHYADALVDAGLRELDSGRRFMGEEHPSAGELASRAVRTLVIRNFFHPTNSYFDDMAWLALAAQRLDGLARAAGKSGEAQRARTRRALASKLLSAHTDDLGGGLFWSSKRNFKNTPATSPAALYFARSAAEASVSEPAEREELTQRARNCADWLFEHLAEERGLLMDGLHLDRDGTTRLEANVYSYNQGPVLGLLLSLGEKADLERATGLVGAVHAHLWDGEKQVLETHGGGDGGLFTGILVRYLALAARDERLPEAARQQAREMVLGTAEGFWNGRWQDPEELLLFPVSTAGQAMSAFASAERIELSPQLQAWTVFEAAASLDRPAAGGAQ